MDRIQLYDRVAGFCERGNGNGSYCAAKGAKLHGQLNDLESANRIQFQLTKLHCY